MTHNNPDPKLSLNDSVEFVNTEHWNRVVGDNNIYMSIPYLAALEKALQGIIDFRYTIFYNDLLQPVAASYIQIMHFVDPGSKYTDMFCHFGDKLKNKLLGIEDARVLICGNVFANGENGFVYTDELQPKEAFKMLSRSMKRLSQEKEKNGHISFGLLKEFWPQSIQASDSLFDSKFKGFMIDVNMVMPIREHWTDMDAYLGDMTAKFRTKAKGVYKKSAEIKVEELALDQIEKYKHRIEELYKAVLSKAEFKFGELNAESFVNFKENLKDQFIMKGYFLKDKLIGFSSVFKYNGISDANYVGIDYDYNRDLAVYQRMLYDLVEFSIANNVKELRLGRTAELVKSSIGAEPVNMKLYLRHRNSISNKLIGPIISSITPSEFELRPPFKKELA